MHCEIVGGTGKWQSDITLHGKTAIDWVSMVCNISNQEAHMH